MKKNRLAISIFALFTLVSCENETPLQSINDDNYFEVKLGFTGEAPNITTTPMPRAGEEAKDWKDWYQIQVYSRPVEDKISKYKCYGYGFFDDTKNMTINLKKGYQYKFVADMIVDAEEKVYKFSLVNSGWAAIGNSFYYSTDEHIRYLGEGYLYMGSGKFNRPDVDRFYGVTEGYVPADNAKVSIKMKRVSFGAKFVPQEFKSGSLEIQIDQSPVKTLNADSLDQVSLESYVSFYSTSSAFEQDSTFYSETIPVNIIWVEKKDSVNTVRTPIVSQDITFKRNHLTTIEFKVEKDSTQSPSFEFNPNEEWVSDTIKVEGTPNS